ncbi:dTDP-4-dehydrorhamnose 3,5-epimerase family protein [Candidatus Sumerlaeota bacterium]|nr:dTDP-4-dehydrorhamnose 3,5-epimerase family protein [Candidatus Sumerlaeota bacterium]
MDLIDGVATKPLRVIPDERGWLMEILRRDDEIFAGFGQVYMTVAYPGVVKGWHWHKKQTDHFCVVKGMMKVVLYDRREGSPTHGMVNEFFIGERNPMVVRIPQGVLHGMKCISDEFAILVNTVTEPYRREEPDEFRVHPHDNDIPYDWGRRDG